MRTIDAWWNIRTVEEDNEDPSGDIMEVHESFDQEHEDENFEEAEA